MGIRRLTLYWNAVWGAALLVASGCSGSTESGSALEERDRELDSDTDTQGGTNADRGDDSDDEAAPTSDPDAPTSDSADDSDPSDPIDVGTAQPSGSDEPSAPTEAPIDPAVTTPPTCNAGPGRVGLQRLTRSEYNRTVRDLFGVTSNPANALPSDSTTSGFDNNASSLSVGSQSLELWLDVAESVAAEAMVNRGREIITCDALADGFDACGHAVLSALGTRVYRRPLLDTELDSLMRFVTLAEMNGDGFEQGIEAALSAMLVSPQFLYRNVPTSALPEGMSALSDYALASRLSYFMWGSTPDDALLARAAAGGLRDPALLRAEFDRMLADGKADALYDGFFQQWLALGKLQSAWPDPSVFPNFSDQVRDQMLEEARLFFSDIVARDGSALEFINGRRTFASETLADIYGIDGVSGIDLVQVDTDPNERAGVLTMPAILTMTSDPTHTNIVRRGSWVADTILCAAPPPPPENVPPLPDQMAGETERERLERHRADAVCAPCHDLIDPLGFTFDHYDAVGRWRDTVDGEPADALGQLPDGRTFDGVMELVALLETSPEYKTCVSQKLMTYALGRIASRAETCVLEAIGEQTVADSSKFSDLLWAVVTSAAFQQQEVPAP